jgi:hypothetical protein
MIARLALVREHAGAAQLAAASVALLVDQPLARLATELAAAASELAAAAAKAAALFEAVQDFNTAALQLAAMGQMDLVQGQAPRRSRNSVQRSAGYRTTPRSRSNWPWRSGR